VSYLAETMDRLSSDIRDLLLGREGVIARLHASGYRIDEPELLSQ
jgi:hypothetical protein